MEINLDEFRNQFEYGSDFSEPKKTGNPLLGLIILIIILLVIAAFLYLVITSVNWSIPSLDNNLQSWAVQFRAFLLSK